MATGALNAQGVWIYGEDDSEATFSALLNKLGTSVSSNMKGRIVQIVQSTRTIQTTSTTSSYADTGLSATITPVSASNKVLVLVTQSAAKSDSNTSLNLRLMRGATVIAQISSLAGYTNSSAANYFGAVSANIYDTPATTSATTYKTMFGSSSGTSFVQTQPGSEISTITLIEVSA